MELKKEELINVNGGSISGSLLNGFSKAINSLLEVGRSLGSAIRRIFEKKTCSLRR